MQAIQITRTTTSRPRPPENVLGFGQYFTDHWFRCDFDEKQGWKNPGIAPYGTLDLDPAAAIFFYAQSIFEGLKAFRGVDGKIRRFRPNKHVERLNRSAARMCMPPMDPELVLEAVVKLVDLDREWVPRSIGTSLYIRPSMIATEPFLGVRPAKSYTFYIILSPVAAYYATGLEPVPILVEDHDIRTVEGGLGSAKTGANYAATLRAADRAKHDGFAQVLYLDGVHRKYLEEVGTMNIMLRIGDEVITPPLDDTILAGVTRDSAIHLLRSWGMTVHERPISIDEVRAAHKAGALKEVWGTGTAAVISPVGELEYQGQRLTVHDGTIGEVTKRLYDDIVQIHYGSAAAPAGWVVVF